MPKREKIEFLPGEHSDRMHPAQAVEITTANLIEEYGLREGTTLDQIGLWLKAKDFEQHHEAIRMLLSDRIKIFSVMQGLKKENFQLVLGKDELPRELNWKEIEAMINGIEELLFGQSDYDEGVAEMMGFPAEKYNDLKTCVSQCVKMEEELAKKVVKF